MKGPAPGAESTKAEAAAGKEEVDVVAVAAAAFPPPTPPSPPRCSLASAPARKSGASNASIALRSVFSFEALSEPCAAWSRSCSSSVEGIAAAPGSAGSASARARAATEEDEGSLSDRPRDWSAAP